jgi:hypothetical protein
LAAENVFGLLVVVGSISCRARDNLIEARSQIMSGVVALALNGMEVGDNGTFAIGDGDVLMAGTLDNGERNDLVRHWTGR